VFEKEFVGAQAALMEAVDDVNRGRDISDGYTLSADVHTVPPDDSFTAAKTGQ